MGVGGGIDPIPAFPLRGGRGLGVRLSQGGVNHADHTFNVLQYIVVPEAQHLPSLSFEPYRSRFVFFLLIDMLATVNFYD